VGRTPGERGQPPILKKYGQHFLSDKKILGAIVDALGPSAADTVVEVGAGRGSLTDILGRSVVGNVEGREHAVGGIAEDVERRSAESEVTTDRGVLESEQRIAGRELHPDVGIRSAEARLETGYRCAEL